MVRKVIGIVITCIMLVGALSTQAFASTHTIYEEGTLSNTYVTYFKDIVSGIGFNENYVAFRSGQYSYTMVVGDLEFNNGTILASGPIREYVFSAGTTSGYNQQYKYYVNELDNFSVNTGDSIIYSDVGEFPQLVERGAKYETLSTILISIAMLSVVISRIFYKR